ncbi:MAG: DedA family protein [Elusimicrobiales bacterium]|nr:DedA family protein [Elusimicrobiales bacterium]
MVDIFLHLDRYLNGWAGDLGPWLYVVLFFVIFCETGLVVTPFLPGDSLLFAIGALAGREGSPINLPAIMLFLSAAAVLGDTANYSIGRWLGPKVFSREDSFWLNKRHLLQAHQFYEKYGGKTIILARFIPIIRTFAPFVAGIGTMSYPKFALYNITGGVAWVCAFLWTGHRFANLPVVKQHFHYVIMAIIIISVLPAVFEYLKARKNAKVAAQTVS